jgi:hypothetical protein
VRVVILKARQLGVSTYIAARYFHRVINNPDGKAQDARYFETTG